MPRIGGDYAFLSRIVHPAAALASNLCYLIVAIIGAAFVATAGVRSIMAADTRDYRHNRWLFVVGGDASHDRG